MLKIDPSDPNAIILAALRQAREAALSLPYAVQIEASTYNTDHPMRSVCSIYAGPNHQLRGCIRLEHVPAFLAGLLAAEHPYIRAAGHPCGARKDDGAGQTHTNLGQAGIGAPGADEETIKPPDLEHLAGVARGRVSRDEETVIVGYGPLGFLTLRPCLTWSGGVARPSAEITGKLSRNNGGRQAELRERLRAAGIEPC